MWELICPSLVAAVLCGAVSGLLGAWALRLRLSALGYAMAHAAFAGTALAFWQALPPPPLAWLFVLAVAALLGPVCGVHRASSGFGTGHLLPAHFRFGVSVHRPKPKPKPHFPGLDPLWGSVLGVRSSDVLVLGGVLAAAAGFLALFGREVWAALVEWKLAEEAGIPAKPILWAPLFLTGATVVGSLRLVGGLLVYALLFLPSSVAAQLALEFRHQLLFAPALGTVSALAVFRSPLAQTFPCGRALRSWPAGFSSSRPSSHLDGRSGSRRKKFYPSVRLDPRGAAPEIRPLASVRPARKGMVDGQWGDQGG